MTAQGSSPQSFGPQPQVIYVQAPPRRTNGASVASLILGLLWFFGIGSLLAVVLGHVGVSECRRNNEGGDGMAVAGLILGYLGLLLTALLIFASANSEPEYTYTPSYTPSYSSSYGSGYYGSSGY